MTERKSKNGRILDMYARLCEGRVINKFEEAKKFGVDERSIQRDIDDIRAFLDDRRVGEASEARTVVYDRAKKGYVLEGSEEALLTNSEILAVSKILLESRAFTKEEITGILDKLISGCVPLKNMKLVSELIANERFHYVELHHKSYIRDKIWELGEHIRNCELLEITYNRQNVTEGAVKRIVEPVALLFSEYYFYLNAYIVEKDEAGRYALKYDYPAIFRVDRIVEYRKMGEKFKIAYTNRFEEGEFRKRIQFMYAGRLTKLQFRYSGTSVEAILDRLPTAKIVEEVKNGYIVEAEVYGKGILMWLLSQGTSVEVIRPEYLRREMRETLEGMVKMYG